MAQNAPAVSAAGGTQANIDNTIFVPLARGRQGPQQPQTQRRTPQDVLKQLDAEQALLKAAQQRLRKHLSALQVEEAMLRKAQPLLTAPIGGPGANEQLEGHVATSDIQQPPRPARAVPRPPMQPPAGVSSATDAAERDYQRTLHMLQVERHLGLPVTSPLLMANKQHPPAAAPPPAAAAAAARSSRTAPAGQQTQPNKQQPQPQAAANQPLEADADLDAAAMREVRRILRQQQASNDPAAAAADGDDDVDIDGTLEDELAALEEASDDEVDK
eukprot:TRINITY_DN22863_c0_g1_i1.p1 TRINITY_DN22863_c0_g1~~TRINITY_DN22863_c0_g1_i1.p1  ORF type:complete len:273 (+),score=117.57 TRINITY_DN22863_c0_g1_i1:87-905(+)